MSVLYYLDKANVVAETLSRSSTGSVSHVEEFKTNLVRDGHMLALLGVRIEDSLNGGVVVYHNSESSLVVEVKSKKHLNPLLIELKELDLWNMYESFF